MFKKIIALMLFFIMFAGAFIYFKFIEGNIGLNAPEKVNEAAGQNSSDIRDTRLLFQKNMAFVYVGELNNSALLGMPYGNICDTKVTFNDKEKSIYFTDPYLLPGENDSILVLKDTNSGDTLMKQDVFRNNKAVRIDFSNIYVQNQDKSKYITVNSSRLFLNSALTVTLVNDMGDVEVQFDDQTRVIKPGESIPFIKSQNNNGIELKSKVIVTNYGMWNTGNMKYVYKSGI